jgi:hypothetical protein
MAPKRQLTPAAKCGDDGALGGERRRGRHHPNERTVSGLAIVGADLYRHNTLSRARNAHVHRDCG